MDESSEWPLSASLLIELHERAKSEGADIERNESLDAYEAAIQLSRLTQLNNHSYHNYEQGIEQECSEYEYEYEQEEDTDRGHYQNTYQPNSYSSNHYNHPIQSHSSPATPHLFPRTISFDYQPPKQHIRAKSSNATMKGHPYQQAPLQHPRHTSHTPQTQSRTIQMNTIHSNQLQADDKDNSEDEEDMGGQAEIKAKGIQAKLDPVTGKQLYYCTFETCTKGFTRKYNLVSHLRVHFGERPFICKLCPTAFSRKHDLRRHNKSLHSIEKAHQCMICLASFARTDALKKHMIAEENNPDHVAQENSQDTSHQPAQQPRAPSQHQPQIHYPSLNEDIERRNTPNSDAMYQNQSLHSRANSHRQPSDQRLMHNRSPYNLNVQTQQNHIQHSQHAQHHGGYANNSQPQQYSSHTPPQQYNQQTNQPRQRYTQQEQSYQHQPHYQKQPHYQQQPLHHHQQIYQHQQNYHPAPPPQINGHPVDRRLFSPNQGTFQPELYQGYTREDRETRDSQRQEQIQMQSQGGYANKGYVYNERNQIRRGDGVHAVRGQVKAEGVGPVRGLVVGSLGITIGANVLNGQGIKRDALMNIEEDAVKFK